jgi:F420H(2)-dependent quinone reductase
MDNNTMAIKTFGKLINALGNWFVTTILRSPFHKLLSRNLLLISFAGRRSGKTYTVPVNYARDGEAIVIVSQADRNWWRNLRDGAPVWVRVQGKDLTGYTESFETSRVVAAGLLVLLRQIPAFRKHVGAALTADGQLERPENLAQLARGRVIVWITDLVAEPALEL